MAVALKVAYFSDAKALADWVADEDNEVGSVVHIVADNNGQFVLFYTEAA